MAKFFFVFRALYAVGSGAIGLAGVSDDIKVWKNEWLPMLNLELGVSVALLASAPIVLLGPWLWSVIRPSPISKPEKGELSTEQLEEAYNAVSIGHSPEPIWYVALRVEDAVFGASDFMNPSTSISSRSDRAHIPKHEDAYVAFAIPAYLADPINVDPDDQGLNQFSAFTEIGTLRIHGKDYKAWRSNQKWMIHTDMVLVVKLLPIPGT